jgi:hypothetical protein
VKTIETRRTLKQTILAMAILGMTSPTLAANASGTPADTIHPNIHTKVGQGAGNNANANPNGANANGGQIHGIGNVPGQNADSNTDGVPGFANELNNVHGGIGEYNKNVGKELP